LNRSVQTNTEQSPRPADRTGVPETAISSRAIELGARWYVFFFLNLYGIGKIIGGQFYRRGHLPPEIVRTLLGDAGPFDLAWTFMGYSFAYILFIGLAEVIGAWLLLWERTKLLGVAVLFPIMVNILVFDVIFLDKYGALASATIYTALLFVILAFNRESVGNAFRALLITAPSERMTLKGKAKLGLAALVLMALLFGFDQGMVNLLGHGKG
jgi:hypothetical protein